MQQDEEITAPHAALCLEFGAARNWKVVAAGMKILELFNIYLKKRSNQHMIVYWNSYSGKIVGGTKNG